MIDIHVKKRDGTLAPLDIDKIHEILEICSDGLNVSVSDTALSAHIKFVNKISTVDIQQTLIKSAAEKIKPAEPDYDIYAGRLLISHMRKEVYSSFTAIPFLQYVKERVSMGVYSPDILDSYTEEEIESLGEFLDYDNNFNRGYASIVQMESKYLIKDIKTNKLLEMPQETFMLIGMVIFAIEKNRTKLIIDFYNALKNDEISLPTPIISGVRTQLKMFSSCCKIKMGDSAESILSSEYALSIMTARRAGIGVDMGLVRGILAPVKNNTVKHTGALPLLKTIEAASKQFTQNSLRNGATVVNYPIFNWEIMDVLEYKNNQGSNTTRARFIDYTIGVPSIFIERLMKREDFTLFSSEEVPDLFNYYGDTKKFDEAYLKYESKRGIRKIRVPASDIFNKLVKERVGTGRIYIHFIDNINNQGMFSEPVTQTNLCSEVFLPTKAVKFNGLKQTKFDNIRDYDLDDGMISLCILGCVNFGKLSSITRMDNLTKLMVRFLDNLIDIQEYPLDAAEWPTKGYRFLGIGVSDFAHFLAKSEARLGTVKAKELTHKWAERFQYGLIKASMELAKERGACEYFDRSEYSKGKLPIDTYNKNVDQIVDNKLLCDWEGLREDIKKHGMRNMSLSAIPPTASSSLVSNSTQGIDPIQSVTDTFESAAYTVKSLVPDYDKEKYYMKAWDMPNNDSSEYIKLMAILQKFIDQGMSVNQWYDLTKIEGKILDSNRVKRDIITAYKYGLKSLYYIRSKDKENTSEVILEGCESGACSI
jgi:ribonucleoside-diphosphate reductase alpha chain